MRFKLLLSLLFATFSQVSTANWLKVNDADYTWGPFKIYNIALFTESGGYKDTDRPLMLTLKYEKPVDGRDFAISIARSLKGLNVNLPNQNDVIDRLKKSLPDLKPTDSLSYIALENSGYFVLNDTVQPEIFDKAFSDALVSIWLHPDSDISHKLLGTEQKSKPRKSFGNVLKDTALKVVELDEMEKPSDPLLAPVETEEQAVSSDEKDAKSETPAPKAEPSEEQPKEQSVPQKEPAKETQPEMENPEIDIRPISDPLPEPHNTQS